MKTFLALLSSILLLGCAQVSPLTGGEKDSVAPKIIREKSTPQQGQLNYRNPEMTLFFDEYIVLKNPTNTISITPQPKVAPTISVKNKKFKLTFNEPLLPNTTYSISFNGAIADLTESNDSLFQYVFSTGPYIDSLKFTGIVQQAYTNKASENVLIGLYPLSDTILTDSLPFKTKPTYITQTNQSGQFQINYIKAGQYQAFAFTDDDRNLRYNDATEQFAFLDSQNCCTESLSDSNFFRLFSPEKNITGIKSSELNYPGQLTLLLNQPVLEPITVDYTGNLEIEQTTRKDSLIYWLLEPYTKPAPFIIKQGLDIDTIRPFMKNMPKEFPLPTLTSSNNLHEGKLLPEDTLSFTFSEPIKKIDNSKIKVYNKDSSLVNFSVLTANVRTLKIIPESDDSARYILIDSAAIISRLSKSTNKTIQSNYERHPLNYYGTLLIDLKADSVTGYVLELLDMKGRIIDQKIISGATSGIAFKGLLPGSYQMRLIKDSDNNKAWTTGDLLTRRQPEQVYYYTSPIKIRTNWDLEIEWILQGSKP